MKKIVFITLYLVGVILTGFCSDAVPRNESDSAISSDRFLIDLALDGTKSGAHGKPSPYGTLIQVLNNHKVTSNYS